PVDPARAYADLTAQATKLNEEVLRAQEDLSVSAGSGSDTTVKSSALGGPDGRRTWRTAWNVLTRRNVGRNEPGEQTAKLIDHRLP
ncbi:hypothetical protein ABZX92_24805, partial [Lentzea sp. NPDC006480]